MATYRYFVSFAVNNHRWDEPQETVFTNAYLSAETPRPTSLDIDKWELWMACEMRQKTQDVTVLSFSPLHQEEGVDGLLAQLG